MSYTETVINVSFQYTNCTTLKSVELKTCFSTTLIVLHRDTDEGFVQGLEDVFPLDPCGGVADLKTLDITINTANKEQAGSATLKLDFKD